MENIIIWCDGKRTIHPYTQPILLSELLPPQFAKPCGGQKSCGKCRVQAYGALSPLCEEEKRLLPLEEQFDNVRLACCAVILGSCTIRVKTVKTTIQLSAASKTYYDTPSPFGESGYVFAVDIGTTTIAVWLIDLKNTNEWYALGQPNAQAGFGADVISRIQAAQKQGIRSLSDAVQHQLDGMFAELLTQHQIPSKAVCGVVLTGNTTMLHFAAGLNPTGLAAAPYIPESLFGVMQATRGLFGSLPPNINVYLTPCVSGFVGGDLVCAVLSCNLKPYDLLVDVGTNGEMAILTREGLLCCSTAAGPAFEGAGLSCGMTAADGAIYRVFQQQGKLLWKTIGDLPPVGICGAGAIEALAVMLELGAMDETGRLEECYAQNGFPIAEGVFITQEDVRALQLAKGAIAAGVDTLLYRAGITPDQVRALYLAGGFGSTLSVQAAGKIRLFPKELTTRACTVGNAAGMGARLCSISQDALDRLEQIAEVSQAIDLAADEYFTQQYMERMLF